MEKKSEMEQQAAKGKKTVSGATYEQHVPWRLMPHVYHAVVVGVVKSSICHEIEAMDVDLIRRQHESLIRTLRELNLRVIQVDLQGSYHTYLLLEQIAVSCNGIVFLPKPRTVVDQNNAKILKSVLKMECSQVIVDQRNPMAKVCGSDVLFTGAEIIVGLSDTTNEIGANELAEAFSDFSVSAIKMPDGADHIKNYVTMAGDMTLAVGPSAQAKAVLDGVMRNVSRHYDVLEVAEDDAANCLFVNQTLIHQAIEEIPESFKIFIEKSRHTRRSICFSEFSRLRAGLTTACILTKKVI